MTVQELTYADREHIFSKEVLTIKDLMLLFDIAESTASNLLCKMKRQGDRLGMNGRIHIEDYLAYFKIDENQVRYNKKGIDLGA